MASVTDELVTVFRTLGDEEYGAAFNRAAGTLDAFSGRVAGLDRQQQTARLGFDLSRRALSFFGDAAIAAAEDQQEFTRAAANLKNSLSAEDIAAWAASMQDLTGIDDERFARVAGVLGTFQIPGDSAKELTKGIFDASESLKALGGSAEGTSRAVGRAIQTGQAGGLTRIGIVVDQEQFRAAGTEAERTRLILQALAAQGGNAAEQFRDSLPGAIQAFNSSVHSAQEGIGESLIGPLRLVYETGKGAVDIFNAIPGPIKAVGTTAAAAGAVLGTVYFGGTLLALNNTIRLAEAHFRAAAGANAQAAAEGRLGGVLATTAGASVLRGGTAGLGGIGTTGGTLLGPVVAPAARGLFGLPAGASRALGTGVGLGAAAAGAFALSAVPRGQNEGMNLTLDIAQGALGGGAIGGTLGSIIPGVGTAVGAGVGAVVGGGAAFFQDQARAEAERKARVAEEPAGKTESALAEQNRLLKEQLDALRGIQRGLSPLDPADLPIRDQWDAILGTR